MGAGKQPPWIVKRTIRITQPVLGEIEVEVDMTHVVERVLANAAKKTFGMYTGRTKSNINASIPVKARLSDETKMARNALAILNNVAPEAVRSLGKVVLEIPTE